MLQRSLHGGVLVLLHDGEGSIAGAVHRDHPHGDVSHPSVRENNCKLTG